MRRKESERRRVLAYNNGGGVPGEPLSQDGIFWSVPSKSMNEKSSHFSGFLT